MFFTFIFYLICYFFSNSTDEDARQAFQLNNGKIKEVQIKLLLSSRTEMQKVIEAARNMQTPFAAPPIQPVVIPSVAPIVLDAKKDDKDSKSRDDKSSKSRDRRRTRSRSRSRDRKDRSRDRNDRRDRRRRDRSRSRDRRDRRRTDRKDRSKSRERTRSRERESRRSRDRRRDSREEKPNDLNVGNNMGNTPDINEPSNLPRNQWDRGGPPRLPMGVNSPGSGVTGLLGNYPGQVNPSLDDARRSLGMIAGLPILNQQSNMMNLQNDLNGSFSRNDAMKRDNWSGKSSRFQDRGPILPEKTGPLSGPGSFLNQNRPLLGQSDIGYGNPRNMPPYQSSMGMRIPFNSDLGGNSNRPFLNRPGSLIPDLMPNRNLSNDYISTRKDFKDDIYRKDNRNRFDSPKTESCVQLRPYYGGYGDVRRFFHGLHISNSGIKFATDANGKRNGTIYVKFVRPEARPAALNKSGQILRGIATEVLPLSEEEFEKCGITGHESDDDKDQIKQEDSSSASINNQPYTCLVVEDLPNYAKEHDILKMFSDYSLLGIHVETKNRHRMAYVEFNKEDDAAKAIGERNKHFLGGKPVTVKPCYDKPFKESTPIKVDQDDEVNTVEMEDATDEVKERAEPTNSDEIVDNAASYDTNVILLTGMPYKTTDRDVIDFFSDIGLVPIHIHMLISKYGPSGECYCEFSSPEEAVAALDKNGMPLGTGIVNVEPFPRKEMERNLGLSPNNQPFPKQGNHIPNSRFMGRLGPRPGMMGNLPRPLLPPNNMMPRMPPNMMGRYEGMIEGSNHGAPGCVLAMENVPFKASVNEILNFFENFDISRHDVLRRYNDNGTVSGDARVTFNAPNECQRAYEECKFKKIRDRTIYLRIL